MVPSDVGPLHDEITAPEGGCLDEGTIVGYVTVEWTTVV